MELYTVKYEIRTDSERLLEVLRSRAKTGRYFHADSFCLLEFELQQRETSDFREDAKETIQRFLDEKQPGELLVLSACAQDSESGTAFFFYDGEKFFEVEDDAVDAEDDGQSSDFEALWNRVIVFAYDCCSTPVKKLLGVDPTTIQNWKSF